MYKRQDEARERSHAERLHRGDSEPLAHLEDGRAVALALIHICFRSREDAGLSYDNPQRGIADCGAD